MRPPTPTWRTTTRQAAQSKGMDYACFGGEGGAGSQKLTVGSRAMRHGVITVQGRDPQYPQTMARFFMVRILIAKARD